MRPKVFIPVLIVLLVVLAILFWPHSNPPATNSGTISTPDQSNSFANELKIDHKNNNEAVASTAITSATQQAIKVDRNNPESIRQYLLSQNVPAKFYGEVIDQDGNPIVGASVKGEVLHVKVIFPAPGGAQDEIIPIDQETDQNGRFEIQGMTGRSVDIESIQKSGYEVEPDYCPHTFGTSSGTYEEPIIFKMWSTNIREQLITGAKKFRIVPDGKPYFIDLMKGEISQTESGNLKVWVKYPQQTEQGKAYDWSCEIDVINGGLKQGDSYSMFSAPADGYVPAFSLQQQIRNGQRGSIGDKKFYVMLNNGKIFGRIQIDLIAPFNMGIPGLIRLSYAINPSGSRILR
jgi:hypothetical protein